MIIDRFEALAAKHKDKIAVKIADNALTFGGLNSLANCLAHVIVSKDPPRGSQGSEQIIALLFSHCTDPVVALLAVLKAGKVYVPLDSKYPEKRLEYMIKDTGAYMIIANSKNIELARRLSKNLSKDNGRNMIIINIEGIDRNLPAGNINLHTPAGQPAYILYTSGSEGKPKGVVQTHQNVVFYTDSYIKSLSITAADRMTFLSSFSHDGAVQDIYASLLSGASLFPFDIRENTLSEISGWLKNERITIYHSVCSVLRYVVKLLPEVRKESFYYLRLVVTGGESLNNNDLHAVKKYFPAALLAHMYGQTESSVNTMGFFNIDTVDKDISITIGKPLADVCLFLLNEQGEEVNEFEVGEIFISASSVAVGYLNDPQRTANVFFHEEELGRIYRTGDLGKLDADGAIQFVGRKDSQVKIRGNRVDLREVESHLQKYNGIKEAVVTLKEYEQSEKYIVAYFVAERGVDISALRNYISNHLPDYMVPSHFIRIEKIPLSPNGKLDRKALPEPEVDRIINHFKDLLKGNYFSGRGNLHVSNVELNTLEDKYIKELLFDTKIDKSKPGLKTIHQIFEEMAAKFPQNLAVVYEDILSSGTQAITYGELNERANRFACILRSKGIKSNSVVALIIDRSLDMITAIIGILKAGGAYLPIDLNMPINQVISLLDECNVSIIITKKNTATEYSFIDLLDIYNSKWKVHKTPSRPQITDFNHLPIPDRSLVDYEKYNKYIGQAMVKNCISLQATRGCPYKCAYCHKIWPKKHVYRTAENIFSEIRLYSDMGVKRFAFIDDVFNLNIKNSRRLFELIIKDGLKVQLLFPNGLRGDILTKEYIDVMIQAGTISAALALESASPRIQELIGKNLDMKKLEENIAYICEKYPGFIMELFTMHGFPTETEKEARMTMDFIKSFKWIHFPYINILRIYSNTDMEKIALSNGISAGAIARSASLAFHELPETLPFNKEFTFKYQADFLKEYFLLKERLLQVLPFQLRVLTEDEIVQKYDSYLDVKIKNFDNLLEVLRVDKSDLGKTSCLDENSIRVPGINEKIRNYFQPGKYIENALNFLLLDLSQLFSADSEDMLYDLVEPPLGPMYVMTYLKHKFADRLNIKIAKSRIDFDSYEDLNTLLTGFNPDLIGIRTLTMHKNFLHKSVAIMRQWGIKTPIIIGGPYATTDYSMILQDRNINLAVLGEGELTTAELIQKIFENNGRFPTEDQLKQIEGIAFVSGAGQQETLNREIIMIDELTREMPRQFPGNLEHMSDAKVLAAVNFISLSPESSTKVMLTHENVKNLLFKLDKKIDSNFSRNHTYESITSIVFTPAPQQIFRALLQGGNLYIPPGYIQEEGIYLFEICKDRETNILNRIDIHMQLTIREHGVHFVSNSDFAAPRDEVEMKLAEICSEVLKVEKEMLGIDTNFFGLGLHSLKAIMMTAKIYKDLKINIPMTEIFILDTIRKLSKFIKEAKKEVYDSIKTVEKKEYYPVFAAQKRLYILQQMDAGIVSYNMPRVVTLEGYLDIKELEEAFIKLIKRHESLRTSFNMKDGEPEQRIHKNVCFKIEIYKHEGEQHMMGTIIDKFIRPFDLSKAPLLRVGLVEEAENRHVLMLDMHHIIADGISTLILIKDFFSLYAGEDLTTLEFHYKDFSEWKNKEIEKELIKNQEMYWLKEFEEEIPILNLPTDYPRPGVRSFAGGRVYFELDKEKTGTLMKIAVDESLTIYMLLLALYNIFLYKITGQEDILVGSPIVGRKQSELNLIVGMFVNMLVLRNFPSGEKSVVQFLKEVKEKSLKAFENQDYQFDDLVEKVNVNRDVSRNPLFDVVFTLNDIDDKGIDFNEEISGLKMRPYYYEKKTVKFDLSLIVDIGDHLFFTFEYSIELFKKETIDRLVKYLIDIMSAVIEDKNIKIKNIEVSHDLFEPDMDIIKGEKGDFLFYDGL